MELPPDAIPTRFFAVIPASLLIFAGADGLGFPPTTQVRRSRPAGSRAMMTEKQRKPSGLSGEENSTLGVKYESQMHCNERKTSC